MIVGLIILLTMAVVVLRLLIKSLLSPEARQIGKVLILVPLAVAGSLLLAFVVLVMVYSFHRLETERGAIVVEDGARGTHVNVSPDGIVIKTEPPRASPGPGSPPAASANAGRQISSSVGKTLMALNQAFVTALRSTFANSPPTADAPRPGSKSSGTAAPSQPPSPASLPALAVTAAQTASGVKPAAAASAAPVPAAPVATKRPAWIDTPPQPSADLYEVAVVAGPWKTQLECQRAMDDEIASAVGDYVAWRIGERARWQVSLPADYAREYLVKDQWLEKTNTSLGEMYNLHALLSFDRQVDGKLRDAWNESVSDARLVFSSVILGGVLLLLGAIYGYLKIDLATAGAYRGRLRFAAAAMVLTLAAAGLVLWRLSGAVRSL